MEDSGQAQVQAQVKWGFRVCSGLGSLFCLGSGSSSGSGSFFTV